MSNLLLESVKHMKICSCMVQYVELITHFRYKEVISWFTDKFKSFDSTDLHQNQLTICVCMYIYIYIYIYEYIGMCRYFINMVKKNIC